MAIEWITECNSEDEASNMICNVLQQGFDELHTQNAEIILNQDETITQIMQTNTTIQNYPNDLAVLLENANHISFYLFIFLVFSAVYLISRWLWRLISDVALGW